MRRMTRYRVRFYHYANGPCYMVERKKWYNLRIAYEIVEEEKVKKEK
jgi:hypothetical protein